MLVLEPLVSTFPLGRLLAAGSAKSLGVEGLGALGRVFYEAMMACFFWSLSSQRFPWPALWPHELPNLRVSRVYVP